MKNNFFASKKPKTGFIALLLLFFGLFANVAVAQTAQANNDTFIWTGVTSSAWNDATNWSILRGTTTAGTNTFPGEGLSVNNDIVYINKNDTPFASILDSQTRTIGRMFVNNNFGTPSGAIFTINSGATLNITTGNGTNNLVLAGGNVINNGALVISTNAVGFSGFPTFGINCTNPSVLPAVPTEYGYSGNGTLSITLSGANFANAAAFAISGQSATATAANATYKLVLNNPTISLNQATILAIGAIRCMGVTALLPYNPKLIIGGTGFTVGTVGSPSIGSLISLAGGASVTVEAETTLTLNSAISNPNTAITGFSSAPLATNITNKGTINIVGASARSGMGFSTGSTSVASVFNISNEGILNVNLNAVGGATGAFFIGNGGGGAVNAGSSVNVANTGTMTLKNTSTAVGTGFAIFTVSASEAAPLVITNNGVLNLEGTTYSYGLKTTVNNNSILNSNSEFKSFVAVNNNVGGSINFVRTAATATTRQVTFTIQTATDISGAIGSIYRDTSTIPNIDYVIVVQKFSGGTGLTANVASGATIPASGTLTRISTGTGTASIIYTAVSIPALNNALPSTTTNSGTINTDTASNLNIISGVTTTSNSVIAPGGSIGKGIAEFSGATKTILGKLILQVAGNTTAGVDYDQITNLTLDGGFDVTGATLDVTGISGTATPVDIMLANGTGTIAGPFASVIGLTTGWSVDYSTTGKVQLVYSATSPTANTWTGATSTSWTDASNWSAGVPDQNSDVTIAATANQPTISTNVNVNSLTIASGATLNVTANNLTVTGAIANSGTMTLASNSNLIQGGTTNTNTGNITVTRDSNALSRLDYTLWSSPVTGSQTLAGFSPETDITRFYNYNETTNLYNAIVDPSAVSFAAAAGYLIRMPNTAVTAPATQTFAGTFTGVPNNGDITKAMTYNGASFGYNAIGNPYPSTIDAQAFIAANTANIESSLYFWRKINAAAGSAYAVYTPLGSTTATPSSALPNGTIQVGQGFFVKAKSASNVTFTNAMRVANNQNQFFKTKQVAQKDRVWLNLTNTSGVFSQALVGYTADATSGVDMYDAKYINDSKIALTSNINDEEYTIQGRPTFDPADVVALNFKTDAAGDYTIALDHFDGVFAAGQDVYLVDSKNGAETNLKSGSYTFNAVSGTDNTRFNLKYQTSLKVDAKAFNDNSVTVYKNNGTLYVNSGAVAISNIKVFDIQGRLIAEQKNVKATTAAIKNLKATQQVLVVKITGEDNNVVTKKVVN